MRSVSRVVLAAAIAIAFSDAAVAQRTAACSADEIVTWIGISSMDCRNCTVRSGPDRTGLTSGAWSFRAEPIVRAVAPGSPAEDVLRTGDVIVAIDGALITTTEGGRRFSDRAPGRPVTFTIRRDGRTQTVRLTPVGLCPGDRRLADTERRDVRVRSEVAAPGALPPVVAPADQRSRLAEPPAVEPAGLLLPSGRMGFGFSCSDCGWERSARGGDPHWFFSTPPQIYNVDPGSPADRAGLRRGDVITHVDGEDIASEDGGRLFGLIRPGQTVRLTYTRGGSVRTATLQADDRSGLAAFAEATETIRRELETLLRDRPATEELRRELEELADLLDLRSTEPQGASVREEQRGLPSAVRYSGTVGNAEVEVRSSGSVITTILEPGKDLLIVLDGARIRIRAPDSLDEERVR